MTPESLDIVEDKGQPVKYTVLEKSLVGNEIFEAGTTCEYAGLPSENLAPQCDIGRARAVAYDESNKVRVAKMRDQYAVEASGLGDPTAFAKAIADAVSAGVAQALSAQSATAAKSKKETPIA